MWYETFLSIAILTLFNNYLSQDFLSKVVAPLTHKSNDDDYVSTKSTCLLSAPFDAVLSANAINFPLHDFFPRVKQRSLMCK